MSTTTTPTRAGAAAPRPLLHRPGRDAVRGLAWRAALVLVALAAVLVGLPVWGRAPLSALAALVVGAALLARLRAGGRPLLPSAAAVVGGAVVLLVLVGVVLNMLPVGLVPASWGVAAALLELGVLAAIAVRPALATAAAPRRRLPLVPVLWGLAVTAILAGAVGWSVASFETTHVQPVAIAAERASGDRVTVVVSAGSASGPYDLVLVTASGRSTLATGVRAAADGSWSRTVTVPSGTRALLQLLPAGSSTPVRQLIVTADGS